MGELVSLADYREKKREEAEAAARRAGIVSYRLRCFAARGCRRRITAAVHAAQFCIALLLFISLLSGCQITAAVVGRRENASIRAF